jgi:protein TonB
MFEDSTFESAGRIKTKTKSLMVVTFITNGFILLLPILIPLICPEALPKAAMRMALVAPPPPPPPLSPPSFHQPPPAIAHMVRVQSGVRRRSEMMNYRLTAPTRIPHDIKMVAEKEALPSSFGVAGLEGLGGSPGGVIGGIPGGVVGVIFGDSKTIRVKPATVRPSAVKPTTPKKVTILASVMEGYLIQKTLPIYPAIARVARITGTVVLLATISKTGRIENLHVVSGPSMLQSAALDAVKTWRYRPYLLNNVPVEVETRVDVTFTMDE